MTNQELNEMGYTKSVLIEGGCSEFNAVINPLDDLDGTFKAYDLDNQEWVKVNGWNCEIY